MSRPMSSRNERHANTRQAVRTVLLDGENFGFIEAVSVRVALKKEHSESKRLRRFTNSLTLI
jgi:hypothetical protein